MVNVQEPILTLHVFHFPDSFFKIIRHHNHNLFAITTIYVNNIMINTISNIQIIQ